MTTIVVEVDDSKVDELLKLLNDFGAQIDVVDPVIIQWSTDKELEAWTIKMEGEAYEDDLHCWSRTW